MYTVAVPVTNWYKDREMDCEETLRQIRRVGAARVWLCCARGIEKAEVLSAQIETLKEHIAYFENAGLEVGVWISSLGHGGALSHEDPEVLGRTDKYVRLVGMNGTTCGDTFCPSGEAFSRDYVDWVGRLAATGVKIIMMDDDYRLCVRSTGNGCCCDFHMKEYRRRLGEDVKREDLEKLILRGGPSRYRDVWLDMGRDALIDLAKKLRARVDEVNPNVRLGMATVLSTWDVDGVDAVELARTLAGHTKPFLRFSGAPYWCASGFQNARPGYVIEVTRMELAWCRDTGVEVFSEGDVYPRPRFNCPASYLEVFDQALRCDAESGGILKYVMDYTSSTRFETGYADAAVRNEPIYRWIQENMTGRQAAGVGVLTPAHRLKGASLPADTSQGEIISRFFYSAAAWMLCDASLPISYEGRGPYMVCDEDGRFVTDDQLREGCAIDIKAAQYLMERGIDVGIQELGPETDLGGAEYFPDYDEHVAVTGIKRARRLTLTPGAVVLSRIGDTPVCFRFENAKGQRFLVYAFDAFASRLGWSATRSYCRQAQLAEGLAWAGRRPLAAVCPGHPDLYIQARKGVGEMSLGLWNMSPDPIVNPVVTLDACYQKADCFRCSAVLHCDQLQIQGEIPPFSFIGVTLS